MQNDTDNNTNSVSEITFVLNNGEQNVICTTNGSIPKPNKSGYYLSGWYADADLSVKIDCTVLQDILKAENISKFISGEYKLYAKWDLLKNMSGVRIEEAAFIYDGCYHNLEVKGTPAGAEVRYEEPQGYKEAGEYTVKATVNGYGYHELQVEGKLKISKARIDISGIAFKDKTVTWDGEAKSIEIEGTLPDGVTVSYENNGNSEAGIFEVTAEIDGGKNYESETLRARLTILARKHKVTFIEEDGTRREMEIEQGGSLQDIPEPKEKRGYIGKWSIEEFGNITAEMEVRAVYELAEYKIEYECNGGRIGDGAKIKYTVLEGVQLLEAEREYYEFAGWYDNAGLEGESVSEIAEDSIGDRKYYAKWKEKEYTVRYELEGGINDAANMNTTDNGYVYTVSSEVHILKAPTKMGSEFVRWKDEAGKTVTEIRVEEPRDMTLTAEWKEKGYSIRYELNGGENSAANPDRYMEEDEEIYLSDATREGYEFEGWYDNAKCIGERVEYINCYDCKDVVLYAKWRKV